MKDGVFVPIEPKGRGRPKNEAAVVLYKGDVPEFDSTLGAPLWLAYASGCFFEHQSTNDFLKPMWETADVFNEASVQGFWKRHDQPPRLPVEVVYVHDGTVRVKDASGNVRTRQAPKPYDRGYTQAVFLASNLTNLPGLAIPLEFTLRRFSKKANAIDSRDLDIVSEVEGRIATVLLGSNEMAKSLF